MSDIRRYESIDALSAAAADEWAALAKAAVTARGAFHVALSGGSTPKRLFGLLAAMGKDALPWDRIHLWWGDERNVPPDHEKSNYRMTKQALLDPLGLGDNVHRIHGEQAASDAARAYREQLATLPQHDGWPVFDYVMLGMGPDGHTASLFPRSAALDNVTDWVVANEVDSPLTGGKSMRITLTAPALNHGREIRFLVGGADKAEPLRQVLVGDRDPKTYPAQLIRPSAGHLAWFVDHAAAARL